MGGSQSDWREDRKKQEEHANTAPPRKKKPLMETVTVAVRHSQLAKQHAKDARSTLRVQSSPGLAEGWKIIQG